MTSLRLGEDEENQRSTSIYHSQSKSQQSLPSPPLSLHSSPAPPEPSHFNLSDDSKDSHEWVSFISKHSKAEKGKGRELVEKRIIEEPHTKGNFVFEREYSEDFNILRAARSRSPTAGLIDLTLADSDFEEENELSIQDSPNFNQYSLAAAPSRSHSGINQHSSYYASEANRKRTRSDSPPLARKSLHRLIGSHLNEQYLEPEIRGSSATLPSPNISPPTLKSALLPDFSDLSIDQLIDQRPQDPLASIHARSSLGNLRCTTPPLPPKLESSNIPFYLTSYVVLPASSSPRSHRLLRLHGSSPLHPHFPHSSPARLGRTSSQQLSTILPIVERKVVENYDTEEEDDEIDPATLPITSDINPPPKLLETTSRHWRDISPSIESRAHLNPDDLQEGRRVTYIPSAHPRRARVKDLDPNRVSIDCKKVTRWSLLSPSGTTFSEAMDRAIPDPWWIPPNMVEQEEEFGIEKYKTGFEVLEKKYENYVDSEDQV